METTRELPVAHFNEEKEESGENFPPSLSTHHYRRLTFAANFNLLTETVAPCRLIRKQCFKNDLQIQLLNKESAA